MKSPDNVKMVAKVFYMNIYKSGWFHREGKPGTIDMHPGDFYEDFDFAMTQIDRPELYMGTIPFTMMVPEDTVANPMDSVPIPLSVTRRAHMMAEKAKGHDIMAEMLAANAASEAAAKAEAAEEVKVNMYGVTLDLPSDLAKRIENNYR